MSEGELFKMLTSRTIERNGQTIPVGSELYVSRAEANELLMSCSAEPWIPISQRYPHKPGELWIRTKIHLILSGNAHFRPGDLARVPEARAYQMVAADKAEMFFEIDKRA